MFKLRFVLPKTFLVDNKFPRCVFFYLYYKKTHIYLILMEPWSYTKILAIKTHANRTDLTKLTAEKLLADLLHQTHTGRHGDGLAGFPFQLLTFPLFFITIYYSSTTYPQVCVVCVCLLYNFCMHLVYVIHASLCLLKERKWKILRREACFTCVLGSVEEKRKHKFKTCIDDYYLTYCLTSTSHSVHMNN